MALQGNNPGNIRLIKKPDGSPPAPFIGEIRPNNAAFRKFYTLETGLRAMYLVVLDHIKRGLDTPYTLIASYAPKGDGSNNPITYAQKIAKAANMKPTEKLSGSRLVPIIEAMARIETGQKLPSGVAAKVASKLKDDNYFKAQAGPSSPGGGTSPAKDASGGGVSLWSDPRKRNTLFILGGIALVGGAVYYGNKKKKKKARR